MARKLTDFERSEQVLETQGPAEGQSQQEWAAQYKAAAERHNEMVTYRRARASDPSLNR